MKTLPTHPMLRYALLVRTVLLWQASVTVMLAWLSPGSLTAEVLNNGNMLGWAVMVGMSIVVALGWADVIVNDVLPFGHFRCAARLSHLGFMLLGAVYWMQAMAASAYANDGAWVLTVNYVVGGALCCWYGWASALRDRCDE